MVHGKPRALCAVMIALQWQRGAVTSQSTESPVSVQPGFLTEAECTDLVRRVSSASDPTIATVSSGGRDTANVHRRSASEWVLPRKQWAWLYERVLSAVVLESCHTGPDGSGVEAGTCSGEPKLLEAEDLIMVRYATQDGFEWHADDWPDKQPDEATDGRLVSVSVQLSPSSTYIGGDLEFAGVEDEGGVAGTRSHRGVGDMVWFPSYLPHTITPVTDGVRFALVAWLRGRVPAIDLAGLRMRTLELFSLATDQRPEVPQLAILRAERLMALHGNDPGAAATSAKLFEQALRQGRCQKPCSN